ncbi:hypothetical protein OUZ56_012445 [Daphnia magna]|uniref:Uncharacterized protein n=1 Tax=Daphnia magna TaxID=35525 RepID=A0ABQ9Z499_9CRUS|nr:hypothetical protein OUZ56_012445 [Daphnia magna]
MSRYSLDLRRNEAKVSLIWICLLASIVELRPKIVGTSQEEVKFVVACSESVESNAYCSDWMVVPLDDAKFGSEAYAWCTEGIINPIGCRDVALVICQLFCLFIPQDANMTGYP